MAPDAEQSAEDRFGLDDLFEASPFIEYADLDLAPFRELPPDLWSESLLRINEGVNLYVDLQTHGIVVGAGLRPGDAILVGGPSAESLGIATSRETHWSWLLRKLMGAPAAVETAPGGGGVPRLRALPSGLKAELRTWLLEEEPGLEAALELIDAAAAVYPAFLRGDVRGDDVLFRAENAGRWERYFANSNPLYAPVNRLTAFVARRLLAEQGAGQVALLEVGAGCGSWSEAFLETIAAAPVLRTDIAYHVTDIAPSLLRVARERVERLLESQRAANSRPIPDVSFALLDLNQDGARWRVDDDSVDLVLAVNVLHTVRDLKATLDRIRHVLRPGGRLLLGECVRPAPGRPVHPEFVFQLIEAFRDVKPNPNYRASWGFLDDAAWRAALGAAGFGSVTFVPDFRAAVAAYPEHTLAAIVAEV